MASFIKSLLMVSEKAANIARVCRSEEHLFSLLVEEKKAEEGNPRFVQDFKTLADVLIQETVRYDLAKEFPHMAEHIRGEESNTFSNTMNRKIQVQVQDTQSATADLLEEVLDGDRRAADVLAAEVHRNIRFDEINSRNVAVLADLGVDISDIGVWIDPIDSTAEYINGHESQRQHPDIHTSGLQCVTVLIGAFNRNTGLPIAGVVNQPFYTVSNNQWRGMCCWGVCTDGRRASSETCVATTPEVVVVSGAEKADVKDALRSIGFATQDAAGAGYKILTVCNGLSGAYVMSRDSIYKWDTCAPHAILRALGGGIIDFKAATEGEHNEITYHDAFDMDSKDISVWRNSGGIIAYRNTEALQKIVRRLSTDFKI